MATPPIPGCTDGPPQRTHRFRGNSGYLGLDVDDGLCRARALGSAARASHDTVAKVELRSVDRPRQMLLRILVAGVREPTVVLLEHVGHQVVLRVPPIGVAS